MASINFNSSIKQLKERNIIGVFSQPKSQSSRFEILEFHGDSTLSYLISTFLLNYKTYYNPHLLTKLRSLSSSNQLLCDFFNLFELDDFLNQEELSRDTYLIKPRADIVECLISELSQSKDTDAELLLKGIVGFLISAGEKELNKEFPHIITQGLLKQPKHHHTHSSTPLNYKSTTSLPNNNNNNNNNNCKKSSLSTVFYSNSNGFNNNKPVYSNNYNSNNGKNFKDTQPKATVSYVSNSSNKHSPILITPSSLSDSSSCKKTTPSNDPSSITSHFENSNNFVKPIDISKSLSKNYKVVNTSDSKNTVNVIDSIIKSQDVFITPNNVNSFCSSAANKSLDDNDLLLSPFSISLAFNTR